MRNSFLLRSFVINRAVEIRMFFNRSEGAMPYPRAAEPSFDVI